MSDFKVYETSAICNFKGLIFHREQKGYIISWLQDGTVYWCFEGDFASWCGSEEGRGGWKKYNYITTPLLRKFLSSDFCELPEIEKAYQENLKAAHNYE